MVLKTGIGLTRLMAILVFGAAFFSCQDRIRLRGEQTVANGSQIVRKDNFELTVHSEMKGPTTLMLHYTFNNKSAGNVYLFNRLYRTIDDNQVFVVEPNLLNIEVSERGILLSKKIVPVPAGMEVEKPSVPCASVIKPGAQFQETVSLSLPLMMWTPYLDDEDSQTLAGAVLRRAWFQIGYFPSTPEADALAQSVKTTQGEAFYFDPFPINGQNTLEVGPLPSTLPIRLRK